MTDSLLWNDHIRSVALGASKRLGFLRRCSRYLSSQNRILIYKAFIRPLLEFNSHLWAGAPSTSLKLVDRIQKRAIRILNCNPNELHSLEHRRSVSCLTLFYRYFHGHCSSEIFSIMPARANLAARLRSSVGANRFVVEVERARTSRFSNSFIPRTSRMWNALPDWVFPHFFNVTGFKRNINNYLISHPLI